MSNIFRRKSFKRPVKKPQTAASPPPVVAEVKPKTAKKARPVVRRRRKEVVERSVRNALPAPPCLARDSLRRRSG